MPDQDANVDGNVPLLQVGQPLEGYIAPCNDTDMFHFELEEGKYYCIDFLGSSTQDGTLGEPNIFFFLTDGPQSRNFSPNAEPVWYRHSDGKRPFSVFDSSGQEVD